MPPVAWRRPTGCHIHPSPLLPDGGHHDDHGLDPVAAGLNPHRRDRLDISQHDAVRLLITVEALECEALAWAAAAVKGWTTLVPTDPNNSMVINPRRITTTVSTA
jgi:hypothetical protein